MLSKNLNIESNKKLLIKSALRILNKKPLSQISYREIASGAGLSHMTAYRYFRTIDELFESVAEEGYHELRLRLAECVHLYENKPHELLEKSVLAYFSFAQSHPHHLTAMFDRGDQKGKYKRTSFLQATEALLEEYLGIIRICQRANILPKTWSENELGLMLWSFSHGYTVLETKAELKLVMPSRPNSEEFVRKGATVFLAGLEKLSTTKRKRR